MPQALSAPAQITPRQDEEIATFQVVLIGNDGVVVGSDRRQISVRHAQYGARDAALGVTAQSDSAFKFKKNPDESIICSYAGGPLASAMARSIASSCQPTRDETAWEVALVRAASEAVGIEQSESLDEVVVVRRNTPTTAWLVRRELTRTPQIEIVNEKRCIGANLYAGFLPARYWKPLPVQKLKQLALFCLSGCFSKPLQVGVDRS
jgi:hypothetical protein